MDEENIARAAELIVGAMDQRTRITFAEGCSPQDMAEGYVIQDAVTERLGLESVGWKIGATNDAAQKARSLREPVSGRLFRSLTFSSPAHFSMAGFSVPQIECEFAFRLAGDLPAAAAPFGREQIAGAIATMIPAIEVADSRRAADVWADGAGLVADNVGHGAQVLGGDVETWRDFDLAGHRVSLSINGVGVAQGRGGDVLGHPLAALTWLANHLARRGFDLAAGQVVTTGSCTGLTPVAAGDTCTADFGDLGAVVVSFGP